MSPLYCGIDFGTSNSTVGVSNAEEARLLPLEGDRVTLPSALFFGFDDDRVRFGRAAIDAYVEGEEGRLMRSLKSILGSSLMHEKTRIRTRFMTFADILGHFIGHLRGKLEAEAGTRADQAVFGRPVRFVDEDDAADAEAEAMLEQIARAQGFRHVAFQFEPIAAALDYERTAAGEELVLIVDIGGGTSDFSIVRVAPERARKADRQDDILANGGVHIGGTDFDRLLSIAEVMPHLGLGSSTADGKRLLPKRHFNDLATWHRINALYSREVMSELRQIRYEAARRDLVDRLIRVVEERRGHSLALAVEEAKIALTGEAETRIRLARFIDGADVAVTRTAFDAVIGEAMHRLAQAVSRLLAMAGVGAGAIDTVFLTGGSSSIPLLQQTVAGLLPDARIVAGDLLGSVGSGLALDARRKFS
ncbi:Hsp70 family protein [Nitratireductor sp. ZSWI3]|uniref:Hsp70 family protein n=1 Tax=Nitratireductor sp. ZSWI3 TaxID=2966359 RepID=UPI00214F920D|nr:Hsp70 family protein [Nitratireductor sp. ZSWI3]MCR4265592.1 Hsp70 family protein [Nitratireductor sp. ZSWI3]